jgi:hypothetical protein
MDVQGHASLLQQPLPLPWASSLVLLLLLLLLLLMGWCKPQSVTERGAVGKAAQQQKLLPRLSPALRLSAPAAAQPCLTAGAV